MGKLNRLLEQEEQFWRQRSNENWVKLGDRNTRYFHQKANMRQRRNCLYELMDEDEVWQEDRSGMEEVVVSYFQKLFTSNEEGNFDEILSHVNPSVTEEMNNSLDCPFTDEEIKSAVFQMHLTKVPGPDGMSLGFYQKHWRVVGGYL